MKHRFVLISRWQLGCTACLSVEAVWRLITAIREWPQWWVNVAAVQAVGADQQATIEEVVRTWWGTQSEESREELRIALAQSSGIPQEVDRELLLQSRERFVRPLSFLEKKQMRSCLRGIAGEGESQEAARYA